MRLAALIAGALAVMAAPAVGQVPSAPPRVGQLVEVPFAVGSAQLPPRALLPPLLGPVAAWTHAHPDGLVVLDGHADSSGSPAGNLRISMRRAETVRDALVALGVDPDRIVIAAYGDAAPSQLGAAHDRRVCVWGTRAGMRAVVARTMAPGHAVRWMAVMTPLDHAQIGAVARR